MDVSPRIPSSNSSTNVDRISHRYTVLGFRLNLIQLIVGIVFGILGAIGTIVGIVTTVNSGGQSQAGSSIVSAGSGSSAQDHERWAKAVNVVCSKSQEKFKKIPVPQLSDGTMTAAEVKAFAEMLTSMATLDSELATEIAKIAAPQDILTQVQGHVNHLQQASSSLRQAAQDLRDRGGFVDQGDREHLFAVMDMSMSASNGLGLLGAPECAD
ncbi:hypothetical protein [Longispora fulva]|uniref:Uncharacterized protein n=2 Tax=Longispora fulva TaxID=619741 RepID=A0A8J7KWG1_9ACTN|nr:hypothetical protein [Longispora fulva]MBG6136532.1 hypothetical protein [Longispora fulva]